MPALQSPIRTKVFLAATVAVIIALGPLGAQDMPDLGMMNKIRFEGLQHSQVGKLAAFVSDVIGPRPTGSPEISRANKWAAAKMQEWGMTNVALEPYDDFGVGWALRYVSAHLLKPHYAPLIAISVEWGSSTRGKITGQPVYVDIQSKADFAKYKGKLRGKIVLTQKPKAVPTQFTPDARRHDPDSLSALAETPVRAAEPPSPDYVRGFLDELEEFFRSEEVGVLVSSSGAQRREYGTVTARGIRQARDPKRPRPLPEVILAAEHYNRVFRIVEEFKEPATMEVEVRTEYFDRDQRGYNVVGEIPGTDKADEVVMLGGHIDSWSPGTGAADDAAGCAVSLEAVRILQALGVKPRRTIRVVLWSAEEKGWVGSKAYVEKHFGDTTTMALKPEHAKVAGYFNFDNGSGRIRGIYGQSNVAVKPIFEAWLEPFHDLGATQVVMRDTGGSDHGALDYIGLPAFQFIQDPLDYGTRVHHTNMDVFDHLNVEDLMQASVIMAAFVYNTAMREEMLPRKPLPDPMKYPVRR
ncbi:MAG: M20/M25/M40 family metallo-hydrolase [Candidatus Aminicenantes bacterium]|nr:M20/M25/M40 family metallo-hydrolase [Candidatus Aminicenantes bacterium]